LLSGPPCAALHYRSYGLYLVQDGMPDMVEKYFATMPKHEAWPIVLLLSFAVCMLSWQVFERAILKLRHAFEPKERSAAG
jgi:peptidoglycan/LPS O-acetylase OafA/YrhL